MQNLGFELCHTYLYCFEGANLERVCCRGSCSQEAKPKQRQPEPGKKRRPLRPATWNGNDAAGSMHLASIGLIVGVSVTNPHDEFHLKPCLFLRVVCLLVPFKLYGCIVIGFTIGAYFGLDRYISINT